MKLHDDPIEHAVRIGFMHLAYHLKHPEFDGGNQGYRTRRSLGIHNGCTFCKPLRGYNR